MDGWEKFSASGNTEKTGQLGIYCKLFWRWCLGRVTRGWCVGRPEGGERQLRENIGKWLVWKELRGGQKVNFCTGVDFLDALIGGVEVRRWECVDVGTG